MADGPDIPEDAPGVPSLFYAAQPSPDPAPLSADAVDDGPDDGEPQWGVFAQDGTPVLAPDSIVEVEHSKEYAISDYPQEQGAFSSYNKVERPYEVRMMLTKGGTFTDKSDFLTVLEATLATTDLYNVVTPEFTYLNANLVHSHLPRAPSKGASLLSVEIGLREVRVTGASTFTKTRTPEGQPQSDGGTVQAKTPTAAESAAAGKGAT